MIEPERTKHLNKKPESSGRYVLYWMQQSQREEYNHALEYAIQQANRLKLPLLVVFSLVTDYPEANLRHFTFMLEGLIETRSALLKRGIKLIIRKGTPDSVVLPLAKMASLVICDCGYLRHQRQWRSTLAAHATCLVTQVESDVIVPVDVASNKTEYAARTIRPKINRLAPKYINSFRRTPVKHNWTDSAIKGESIEELKQQISSHSFYQHVEAVSHFFKGGTGEAKKKFENFLEFSLAKYNDNSNQPQTNDISQMSPYLHFGQISPLYLATKILKTGLHLAEPAEAFLEQLIVRRELAINFVYFTPDYDKFSSLPDWAKVSLNIHRADRREYIYNTQMLEDAATHDPYWNAAMREMTSTGFMHNYMRMYWGKKILEWSTSPQQAYETTLYLNNKYFLDGRDANSYTGVAWIFGKHDRPWKERSIFGKVRYMNSAGLERKCDIKAYVEKVKQLCKSDPDH